MKWYLFLTLLVVGNQLTAQNHFVYMGNLLPGFTEYNNIRFDRYGEIYPEVSVDRNANGCYIQDNQDNNSTRVSYFLNKQCGLRNRILAFYGLDTLADIDFDAFERIVAERKFKAINNRLLAEKIDNVTFLMVGYNNHYENPIDSTDSAPFKLRALHAKVDSFLAKNNKRSLLIDVYWDGTESEERVYAALNFSYSSANSFWAGLGLREIVNGLRCKKVQFITHSLAANIVAQCVFNQYFKINQERRWAKQFNEWQEKIPPPTIPMAAAIIAPAIPGTSTFIDYVTLPHKYCDFIIGYNTNDQTLQKDFLPMLQSDFFTKHFSSTSLGCLATEVEAVKTLFQQNNTPVRFFDFSIKNRNPQTQHDLAVYISQPQYDSVLMKLYNVIE